MPGMAAALLQVTARGLYCAAGDFYVDPWQPVERAVITHAHSDHARAGSGSYLASADGEGVLRARLGDTAAIRVVGYGEQVDMQGVRVSLHPAGHILGSAQVRIEYRGEVWCVSGDYKIEPDSTCAPYEPVRCHTFITESTFGLPIFRWRPQAEVFGEINAWWRANQAAGRASLLLGYALGKAQRLLAGVDHSIGPIVTHGAVERLNAEYRAAGVSLPSTTYAGAVGRAFDWSQALIVAPPSAEGSPWVRRFGPLSAGFASGWMRTRATRRRRGVDQGFTLSDHTDWPGLLAAIEATGAEHVLITHGYAGAVSRYLRERGLDAHPLEAHFASESADTEDHY
jgi:putative mRNA 3-end processing factor